MGEPRLTNTVKQHRDTRGWSQQELAERVGVTRQAVIAIEAGRQVPSTLLGLQLAQALGCRLEELFHVAPAEAMPVRMAPRADERAPRRVALGQVDGVWVAHPLPPEGSIAADGLVVSLGPETTVRPVTDLELVRRTVLVAGCAPILGALAQRVGTRFAETRVTWLPATSRRALELLGAGLIHVAGIHRVDSDPASNNVAAVQEALPERRLLVVNLTRWRQGLVVPAGNPRGIRVGADLLRPGLRLAHREEGAAAQTLVARLLREAGPGSAALPGPFAAGHVEVAELVRAGAADAGVAIEAVALAMGLDFVALSEERFDLVLPAELAETPPVARLLDGLDHPAFRAEMAHLPGYDGALTGQVTTVEPPERSR